jgi:predicted dehydrogenase
LTRHDAARAIDACRRFGVVLALGENNRFWPNMQEMQRIVASGELVEPMHIEGHTTNENSGRFFGAWRHLAAESPGGGMTGAGIHVLDAFIHLMGPVQSVNAQLVSRKPPPDPTDSPRARPACSPRYARRPAIVACTCSAPPARRKPWATPSS